MPKAAVAVTRGPPTHRWLANAEADRGGAILRRRALADRIGAGAAAAKAVDARGPRCGRKRPTRQRRSSGGWRRTRPQTEPAESEERDPPTGPALRRLRARVRPPRASVSHGDRRWADKDQNRRSTGVPGAER